MTLGPLTFLAPLSLLGLLALPLIYLILRVTPPAPKKQIFPPLRILQDIVSDEETPNSTPLWLWLFRLLLFALIAFALAKPVINQTETAPARPLTLVIDNSWASAPNWGTIIREAEGHIKQAQRDDIPVLLLPTIAPTRGTGFIPATQALAAVKTLNPHPLPIDEDAVIDGLNAADITQSNSFFLSSGIDYGNGGGILDAIGQSRDKSLLLPATDRLPLVPDKMEETATGFRSIWRRAKTDSLFTSEIVANGRDGRVLARSPISFAPGLSRAEAEFNLPAELRSRISALRPAANISAGSVRLLDDSWGRPLIGIITNNKDTASPLLSEPFYTQTAINPFADIFTGPLSDLLPLAPSIIIMPDEARTESQDLVDYTEQGGLLIRFAGPKLAEREDNLLPVTLRGGGRALGGALTWEDPQSLAPFTEESPFFGLKIPDDVRVTRQIMAQPGAETDSRTWARLADGSPVVTAAPRGLGRVVLFHISAAPDWSNLPVSGLYVDMLRRLMPLARSAPSKIQSGSGDWAPERVLNGYGGLRTPDPHVKSIANDSFDATPISMAHPPGLYRQATRRKALNTVRNPKTYKALSARSGIKHMGYGTSENRSLGGMILALALIMLALDVVFSLLATGRWTHLRVRRKAVIALFAISITVTPAPSEAQDTDNHPALSLHLAYVITGNARIDRMSDAAMNGLATSLNQRTTIEPTGAKGVIPGQDDLVFYPFLYFPVDRDMDPLTDQAAAALNAYMNAGGTLVFDTQDQGDRAFISSGAHPGLQKVTAKLDIPTIAPVPDDHVLKKAFYLIDEFPGRWASGRVWVEKDANGTARDGVSSVIIGANDWAAGWAITEDGEALTTLEQDIPRQREMSIRYGVNLAMYALSGNYKSDQVHAAALIERLDARDRLPKNLGPSRQRNGPRP